MVHYEQSRGSQDPTGIFMQGPRTDIRKSKIGHPVEHRLSLLESFLDFYRLWRLKYSFI